MVFKDIICRHSPYHYHLKSGKSIKQIFIWKIWINHLNKARQISFKKFLHLRSSTIIFHFSHSKMMISKLLIFHVNYINERATKKNPFRKCFNLIFNLILSMYDVIYHSDKLKLFVWWKNFPINEQLLNYEIW
jgi:hypothetical protein